MELYELMLIEDITDSTLDAIQYANEASASPARSITG